MATWPEGISTLWAPIRSANIRWAGRGARPRPLAEGEDVGTSAGVEQCDLEGPVRDRPGLADQLVKPGLGDLAVAPLVDVHASRAVRGLAIEQHQKAHG